MICVFHGRTPQVAERQPVGLLAIHWHGTMPSNAVTTPC